ncbi:hypothetical protein QK285_05195 [Pseudarthrobacter sp. AL20]|nr:hypothetical protein [Pseudarthrobacter sp. AL20]
MEQFERDAVAAGGQCGVKQTLLATLTGRSPGHISQIISATPTVFDAATRDAREQWRQELDNRPRIWSAMRLDWPDAGGAW